MDPNGNILIVDDDRRMAKTLVDILGVKGYQAKAAYSAEAALEVMEGQSFNCILTDIKMPGVNGVEFYTAIKEKHPYLPVILMTAYSTDKLVEEGLNEGVIACMTKPLDLNMLMSFFSSLRKERSIVIIDDDPEFCRTLGDILEARDYRVVKINDPKNLKIGFETVDPTIVLLDMNLKTANGVEVLQEIRVNDPHQTVILVTGYRDEMSSSIEAALKLKAYTCLYKPLQIEQLIHVLSEVHHKDLGRVLGRTPEH